MLVGASSMWWHGHHSQLGDIADTVSILLFASAVALLFFRKLIHSWVRVIVAYCSLLVVTLFAEQLPYLNGSLPYIVLLVGLIIISVVYIKRFNKNKFLLLSSIGVFGLALLFRTLDMASCSLFPIGTHFLWHIFVAIFGYLLILVVGRDQLKS
jgi:hemolysin III